MQFRYPFLLFLLVLSCPVVLRRRIKLPGAEQSASKGHGRISKKESSAKMLPRKKSVHPKRERERIKENRSRAVVFYGFFRERSCTTHRPFSRASSRTKSISRTFSRVRASRSMLTERRNKKRSIVLLDFIAVEVKTFRSIAKRAAIVKFPRSKKHFSAK